MVDTLRVQREIFLFDVCLDSWNARNIREQVMKKAGLTLIFMAMTFAVGCQVKQPGTPRWEAELTVPIADRVYSLEEIVADSSQADTSSDWVSSSGDTLFLNFTDALEKMYVEQELQYDGINEDVETQVGILTVNAPGNETVYFSVLDSLDGLTLPGILPFEFGPLWNDPDEFSEYEWVELASGNVTVTVTNHLPVTLTSLNIRVFNDDPDSLQLMEMDVTAPLPSGASVSMTEPLPTGERILNHLTVRLTGTSPGSSVPVTITDENDNIQTDVEISFLEVTAAMAHIPSQSFDEDTTFTVAESDTIAMAVIKNGAVSYSFTNETELINNVTFVLPDFTLDGEAFSDNFMLTQGATYSVEERSLVGYQIYRPNRDNQIRAQVMVGILDTSDPDYDLPGNAVEINQYQSVESEFQITQLYFSSFQGYLDNRVLVVDQPPAYMENIPEGLNSLAVEEATVEVHLENVIGAVIDLDLALYAYKDGTLVGIYSMENLNIPPGDTANPGALDTVLSGLQAIVNVLPGSILLTGQAVISGQVDIEDWQWLEGTYWIRSPFSLAIGTSTLEPELTILDDGFDNKLNQVDLTLNLENHAPLSGEAYILASYDSTDFGSAAVDTFIHVLLPQATVDLDGYVTAPGVITEFRTLDIDQLEMFAGADQGNPLFIKTYITIQSTEGLTVRFRPEDHITVGASAHLLIDVDLGDSEGP